jgi:uncharacterized protein (TIGR03437 family)
MKYRVVLFVLAGLALRAQIFPVAVGPNPNLSLPAVDDQALTAVVSSSVSPDGQIHTASDLYLLRTDGASVRQLTNLPNNGASWVDLSADGSKAAYNVTNGMAPGMEEVHVIDVASGADLKVATDTAGCIQPLGAAICFGCFFSCIRSVHFSPDASKVVYSASENQPLYVVNADGSGVLHLPIQGATLAPSPTRVVSRNGLLVFTLSDGVYTMNLDGSGMRKVADAPDGQSPTYATISEDGSTIVFQAFPENIAVVGLPPPPEFYIAHLDGTPAEQLTGVPSGASPPSLSADGSQVAYAAYRQIYVQRTDGTSPPIQLANFTYLTAAGVTLSGDASTALVWTGSAVYTAASGVNLMPLYAPRMILPGRISSMSGQSPPSPGSRVKISGWNFQNDAEAFSSGYPLPSSLGGISVTVAGQTVPLFLVTASEIDCQLPFTTPAGMDNFVVDFGDGTQATAGVNVPSAAAEILQYNTEFFTSNYGMAFHAGTAIVADQNHPASAGEALETYGIGLGAVNPAVDAGVPAPTDPLAYAIATPQVKIGNKDATVTYAGLAPGLVGMDQVNIIVPSGLKSGSQPISWAVSGQPPTATWTIWVK